MKIAKVIGNIVSTVKHSTHYGMKLMIVQPVDCYGESIGKQIIAADYACAGEGDFVLVVDEGGASRQVAGDELAAIDAVIVGVLDCLLPKKD